ncbi:MAG: hypothetical protein ABEN55_00405 [Bradymonadaceae bacterium]
MSYPNETKIVIETDPHNRQSIENVPREMLLDCLAEAFSVDVGDLNVELRESDEYRVLVPWTHADAPSVDNSDRLAHRVINEVIGRVSQMHRYARRVGQEHREGRDVSADGAPIVAEITGGM